MVGAPRAGHGQGLTWRGVADMVGGVMKKKRNAIPELPAGNIHGKNVSGGWFALARGIAGKVVPELHKSALEPSHEIAYAASNPAYAEQVTKDSPDTCSPLHATDFTLSVPDAPPALLAFPTPAQAAAASPEDLQPVFARELQRLIAAGLPDIPAPRSIKELASMVGVWRGLARLDKIETSGQAVLVAPMRSVQRRRVGPVVEVAGETLG